MKKTLLLIWILIMSAVPLIAQTDETLGYDPTACADWQNISQACLDMMEAYPEPTYLEDLQQDRVSLNTYSFWRVGPEAVNLYDGPGGNVIGQIPAGFNFINAVNSDVEGWLQREGGEWVSRADATFVEASQFTGVRLPEGWEHPFAWVLDQTGIYASTSPGGPSTSESGLVPLHHQRFNIFAQEEDSEGWLWYMVGPNQWVKQIYLSVIQPAERPDDVEGRWVAIDLFEQSLIAYEEDTPVFATLVSSGLPQWETNEGVFEIWARLERDAMSGATGAPDAYALQSVPWTMYFDGDISLHGTYWHKDFGYRRSHGCVNLSISDAKFIFDWTRQTEPDAEGNIVNYVYVFSSDEYR